VTPYLRQVSTEPQLQREKQGTGAGGGERLSSPARSLRALLGGADKWRLSQQGLAAIESL
jgi:hypothetical protein